MALSDLSAEANHPCLIYRLPPDILEPIFIQCAHDYWDCNGEPTPAAPSWVNVSYVSHHWRNVALGCPILWTYLFITSSRWTSELLARSKEASLKLYVYVEFPDQRFMCYRFLERVASHAHRIEYVRLFLPTHDYGVLSKLSSPAPRLRFLDITMYDHPAEGSSPLLFDGDTPALRKLYLTCCPLTWYSLNLSGLTELILQQGPNLVHFPQSLSEFLATLSGMRNLQHLHFSYHLAVTTKFFSSAAFHSFQKINLPHLSVLVLSVPLLTMFALLYCVDIPLDASIRLWPDGCMERTPNTYLDDIRQLFSLLAERYDISPHQTPNVPLFRSLILAYNWTLSVKLIFSVAERYDDHNASISGPTLRLRFRLLDLITSKDRDPVTSLIYRTMPRTLSNVQSLHVVDPQFSSTFWADVLGHLPELRYLKLSNGNMPNLASALSHPSGDRAENQDRQTDRGQLLVPSLVELVLHGISFSRNTHLLHVPAVDVQSLCHALSTRRREPRGRLVMTRCEGFVSAGHLEMFDLEGSWGDGHFDVACYKGEDY